MSQGTEVRTEQIFDVEKSSSQLPGPEWLIQRRKKYVGLLSEAKWPTSSEELWRYTDIDNFDLNLYRSLLPEEVGTPGEKTAPGGGIIAAEAGENGGLIILKDGRVVHCHLDEDLTEQGVILHAMSTLEGNALEALLENLGAIAKETSDAFTLLNEAMSLGGAYISIPKNVVVNKPIVIVHWSEGVDIASFPRTFVHAHTNSAVNLIERFESSDENIFISSITETLVEENAQVKFLTTQEEGKNTQHIGLHRAHIQKDGRFESSTVSLGGKYVRHRGEVALLGEGANSDVMAVYYGDNEQLLDFRTFQDHRAPHTTSNLLFKGAVEDRARSVYSGLIRIREDAQKTEAYQTNRNLVLDHGAHAESIPNLVIEANDVKCSHGSTVGPIDEDQLYYLETRGVDPQTAEKLIVLGFFEDVFARLSIPALIEPLRRTVNDKLSALAKKRETEND